MCSSIATRAMEEVWGRTPNHFQSKIIPLTLQMMAGDLTPQALLLVQPAGSGKFSVPQTASVVSSGVTIIIELTLALSSDQSSKFTHATNVQSVVVHAYQLDFQKNDNQRNLLANNLLRVLQQKAISDISTGVVLFILLASPETMLLSAWTKLVDEMVSVKMLNILCLDEVHLFIDFGLFFRRKFLSLRDAVFNKLIKPHANRNMPSTASADLIMPLLCMTATLNPNLLHLLQRMINIAFDNRQLF